jgi:hypothetical protein
LQSAHRISPQDDSDFYPTGPWGARAGAELVKRLDPGATKAWDPCCGAGHMVHGLRDYFPTVVASDLLAYNGNSLFDFTARVASPVRADWIFGNPPFKALNEFIELGLARARRGLAIVAKLSTLETLGRYDLVHGEQGHAVFAPFIERLPMHKGRWEPKGSTAASYAWFIWFKPGVGFPRPVVLGAPRAVTIPIPPGTRERLTRADDAERFGVRG